MKVMILGGGGMLGHRLWQIYRDSFDAWVTVRSDFRAYARYDLFDSQRLLGGVDVLDFETVVQAVASVRPDVVINCIGIVKQLSAAKDPIISLTVNSLFPHRLAKLCQSSGARLIHLSTDCVFSGRKGLYTEDDVSDADDLYGRTKFLGELSGEKCLTIRTSIIGRELRTSNGLVEWFLGLDGAQARGYCESIFSGFTTTALSGIIGIIISEHPDLDGVWHVAANPINKFDLLELINKTYGLEIEIIPDAEIVCDRSLDGSRFETATGFAPPDWQSMIEEMAKDPTPYNQLRRLHAHR